jgi:hypothetical protein
MPRRLEIHIANRQRACVAIDATLLSPTVCHLPLATPGSNAPPFHPELVRR